MLKEFKEFIAKGNVLDLAVAVILATYFGAIVKSLVDDIIMPVVGTLIGGIDFKDKMITIKDAVMENGEVVVPEVALRWGLFVNNIITFLIVGFSIFIIVKAVNRMNRKKEEEAAAAPPAPPKSEVLLEEIRDLLKK
jgi:large conductance mechanosensitive channel